MKKILLPLIVLFAVALNACNMTVLSGSGKFASSSRPVSGYTRLVFDAPGELTITQNGKEALRIEGDDNLLQNIKTEVKNGELHIYVEPNSMLFKPTQPIRYALSVKNLEQVSLDGSGTINAADLKSDQLALKLNGSGDMTFASLTVTALDFGMNGSGSLDLQKLTAQKVTLTIAGSGDAAVKTIRADELQATISGSGKYTLTGKVTRQTVHILGSGEYAARSLESAQTEISVTGSGNGQVWASETLNVSILGSGDVGYVGKPKITQQVAGSGSISVLQ